MESADKQFMTPKELSNYLGVSLRKAYRYAENNQIKHFKTQEKGSILRFYVSDVKRFVEENTINNT
jgi:excisionase family DNA binding protein